MDDEHFVQIGDKKILTKDVILSPIPQGRITDEKLPQRFGNRKTRRRLQSEIRKIKDV